MYCLLAQPLQHMPSGLVITRLPTVVFRHTRPVERIKRKVALFYGIAVEEMSSARRGRSVARPRQVAMYLARELTPKSLPEIGRLFGNRDHTTVIHAIRTVERLIASDPDIAVDVEILREALAA